MTTTIISSGVVSSGLQVKASDELDVLAGGEVISTSVSSGGVDDISGLAVNTIVSSGGIEIVSSGGRSSGAQLHYGDQIVYGQTSAVHIFSGLQTVSSGGVTSVTVVRGDGALQSVQAGGTAVATFIGRSASQSVLGVASASYVSGMLDVLSGGVAVDARVLYRAEVQGTASNAIVSSGGAIGVDSGGLTIGTVVKSGAMEFVGSAGSARATQVLFGGTLGLEGSETGTIVSSGGTLDLFEPVIIGSGMVLTAGVERAQSVLSGATLRSGAVLEVGSAVLSIGGSLYVEGGGTAFGAQVRSGGVERVFGSVGGDSVSSGGREVIFSGGVSINAAVFKGGVFVVSASGLGSATHVSAGGSEVVNAGGLVSATQVSAGGSEVVFAGGTVRGTILSAGYEYDYGSIVGTVISSGGIENVSSGGKASGVIISSGGTEHVLSGGVATNVNIYSGGVLEVFESGVLAGGVHLSGGTAIISGADGAGNAVIFTRSAGTLELDNIAAFHAKISGFLTPKDRIDLGTFAYSSGESVSWIQSGTSGTLTVHDGTISGKLTFIGSYVAEEFQLSSDGHGGTLLTDPPIAAATPATARLVQAAAGLHGRGAPADAEVHAGGTALLSAAPVVTAATSGR